MADISLHIFSPTIQRKSFQNTRNLQIDFRNFSQLPVGWVCCWFFWEIFHTFSPFIDLADFRDHTTCNWSRIIAAFSRFSFDFDFSALYLVACSTHFSPSSSFSSTNLASNRQRPLQILTLTDALLNNSTNKLKVNCKKKTNNNYNYSIFNSVWNEMQLIVHNVCPQIVGLAD